MKLKTKFLIKGLFHSLLQFISIFTFAWFNSCIFEMSIIYVCFFLFRTKFEKQYHALTTWGCTILTMVIFYLVSCITPEKSISVILVIIFTYTINKVSYYYRDYLDIKNAKNEKVARKKKNTNRQLIIDILGTDNLDEESIEKYCVSKGVPKLCETIYLFLNNTMEDVSDILEIDMSTITRRIKKFIDVSLKD